MIEKIIDFSCRNRFIVIVLFLGVTAFGVWTLMRTPVDAIPDLSENQVIVFTDWPGRSPREIEDQITYPLSVNLQGLAGVKAVRSSSEFNFSMINIIFEESADFYFSRTRVLERLALASTFLPQGVVPYLAPDATALGQVYWYTVEGDNTDLGALRSLQDWYVRYQLNSVPGVAQVASVGGFPREYQVDVTPEKLRAYQVTLGQIFEAIAKSNSAVGGRVVQKGNAEYIIRGVAWLRNLDDIRNTVITLRQGLPVRVGDVASVQTGSEFRRSTLEKDGREVTGGVVMMRYGENPREVIRRVKIKIRELQKGLPAGVRIVPFYDRTGLIDAAIHTVTRVLEHEVLIAGIAILLILTHLRSTFVVVLTLPLSILAAFILMRWFGISSNIMSLSGIAISIGILVDQAIVMLENSTHHLTLKFGDDKITGDTTDIVATACRQVGRPIFFSVIIMLISFLPVFALSGQEGKLFHPLAFTKSFALIGTAIISITLVPALIPLLVRGRLSREEHNWIIRSVVEMYRPVLQYLLKRPKTVIWLFVLLLAFGFYFARHLGREFMPPLDEGSILDMPITAPRASVTEVADDLKLRDTLIRAFPEVESVVGKGGRAETPTDPSPLDMVESVINLTPRDAWVKRKIKPEDAEKETDKLVRRLESDGFLKPVKSADRKIFVETASGAALARYDAVMRQELIGRRMAFEDRLATQSARFLGGLVLNQIDAHRGWNAGFGQREREAFLAAFSEGHAALFARQALLVDAEKALDGAVEILRADKRLDANLTDPFSPPASFWKPIASAVSDSLGMERLDFKEEAFEALRVFREKEAEAWAKETNQAIFDLAMREFAGVLMDEIQNGAKMQELWPEKKDGTLPDKQSLGREIGDRVFLWKSTKNQIVEELDKSVRMVGWANIWTQPIINRVDMLATGVRTQVGIKVFGRSLDQIQKVSNEVANIVRGVRGAVDVVADQTVGKGYIEIEVDRERAARYNIAAGDVQDVIEVALGGKGITTLLDGRERYPVRLRYARDYREDEDSIKRILVSNNISLGNVATVKVVEGPVMIKSENGLLRSYVQLNVRDRDIVGFVEEARRSIASKLKLPEGSYLEWTGQFEHQVRARNTLRIVFPAVLLLIFTILFVTYNDLAHAVLMMLAVPGALAGGVLFQALFGYNFSVAVWVGYIACFGMATETGIIMLVYLRDAIHERGGLQGIGSLEELEQAILAGAVHRLRPKLLTEGTAIIGLAPMLWASGAGAEVIAPMAAPVLGGLLIADEVIDIFLPVLFYQVEARRWKKLRGEA